MSRTYKDQPFDVKARRYGLKKKPYHHFPLDDHKLSRNTFVVTESTNDEAIDNAVSILTDAGYDVTTREVDGYFLSFAELVKDFNSALFSYVVSDRRSVYYRLYNPLPDSVTVAKNKKFFDALQVVPVMNKWGIFDVPEGTKMRRHFFNSDARHYLDSQEVSSSLSDDYGIVLDRNTLHTSLSKDFLRHFVSVTIIEGVTVVEREEMEFYDIPGSLVRKMYAPHSDDYDYLPRPDVGDDFKVKANAIKNGVNNSGMDYETVADIADSVS